MTSTIARRLDSLLAEMTLDEKLAQLGSYWMYELQTEAELDPEKVAEKLKNGIGQVTRVAGSAAYDPQTAAKVANQLQRFLIEETRLRIPAILHEECCSGAMFLGGTIFPQILGLTATFQPELAEAMTTMIRAQLLAVGARQALAPVLDIARDPRWGRIEETFGEDPILASQFGVAYIKGLQGENLSQGVLATGKHFIGHSFSQGGLNCAPVHIGWRDLYETYLVPFQAAIRDAGLGAIMNAYPELDGEVVAASRRILTDILRNELGFDGLVVSDYEAVSMLYNFHYLAPDYSTAARLALEAGIDVELPSTNCYGNPLRAALYTGEISLETIDRSVRNHLKAKFELGLFDNPYVDEGKVLEVFETPQNRELAREIAVRSMVLLKNDGSLPIKKSTQRIAVIGPNADNGRNLLGDYSFPAMRELMGLKAPPDSAFMHPDQDHIAAHEVHVVSVLEGIRAAVAQNTDILYAQGCDNLDDSQIGFEEAVEAAQRADIVVLVLGDRSGLVPYCTTGETRDSADLHLPAVQENLARAVAATGTPLVVVLASGRPYAIPWLAEKANAILQAWLPGEEGGNAVASILFGDANPGGKLPVTMARSVGQVPLFYNAKPAALGSHWYKDYVTEKASALYPFGHGLSYTEFVYQGLQVRPTVASAGEQIDISLMITNTGLIEGDEVVQLYIRDEYGSVPRPVKELKGYLRVRLLPGESKTVTFHLPVNQLAFFDTEMHLVLEAGKFIVMLGSSSEDIRLTSEFSIGGANKTPIQKRIFYCPVDIK